MSAVGRSRSTYGAEGAVAAGASGAGGSDAASVSTAGRSWRFDRGASGGGAAGSRGGGSMSGTDSVALPASTSSRYGFSDSVFAVLDGRRPRPRRGGRRLSLMLMVRIKRVMLIRRSPKLLAELRASEKRELRDGKTLAATRLNYRYRRGAGNLTRSRRCWRNGAARALQPDPNPSTCHSGVRRGRAGGRQEYRHFPGPAQPSKSCRRVRLLKIYWFPQPSMGINCAKRAG